MSTPASLITRSTWKTCPRLASGSIYYSRGSPAIREYWAAWDTSQPKRTMTARHTTITKKGAWVCKASHQWRQGRQGWPSRLIINMFMLSKHHHHPKCCSLLIYLSTYIPSKPFIPNESWQSVILGVFCFLTYPIVAGPSYRYYPVNLDVISWLGVWYVKSELYEKAVHYFEAAAQIQPTEVRGKRVWDWNRK